MTVTNSDLIRELHRAIGGPPGLDGETGDSESMAVASAGARALSAAAACSAVVARLFLVERDEARVALRLLDPPQRLEPGVTALEESQHSVWSATVRAVAAAGAEVVGARSAWEVWDTEAASAVRSDLDTLLQYVDRLALLLESTEP